MKKYLIILVLLLAVVAPNALAQRRSRGFWHQEWTIDKGDKLKAGCAEGNFALQGRAEEKTGRITYAIEGEKKKIVAKCADNGGNYKTPNCTLNKAEQGCLESLALYHHTGFQRLDCNFNNLCGAYDKAHRNRGN